MKRRRVPDPTHGSSHLSGPDTGQDWPTLNRRRSRSAWRRRSRSATTSPGCTDGPGYRRRMPMFLMFSTLGPDGAATLRENPDRLRAVNAEVEALGVHVLQQFALLGPYDFCNILDAPDEKVMARVALILG